MSRGNSIDISKPYCFYARRRPKTQIGFHNLFCGRHNIPVELVIECLNEYETRNNRQKHQPWSKEFVLDCCSTNFHKFLKIVTEKTGVEFKNNPNPKRRHGDTYDDWWQRSNMDGSFA